ncbi:putative armadillo/beta-catenin-like repeat-containing protein [Neospora caninum Liverpool]|uniref:Armadillo/beta-catenin-like repeat-containing protein, putative n=1 Tax=Neospora caninum (strain Liverpool) TaxID=572307 RepID=F0VKV5_NEOCL|nr:putative armadillo/beta-catenin-like repeat-containing protein [Neospora caninum Liverpool]CBZ54706.1 putative armadillo/beta-catenin-like repeat-containing protein [Neospora caninum Liverpool]CEL69422.1 TPA: armadillo/beta-catenin-like repeat-containing protein, putative [Neospora caninum Liverpool]|eukprot:XP_003884736.1 putative armadillo/beta-catenin-like repeat-containing protein [Neospora caninum Liverpool]
MELPQAASEPSAGFGHMQKRRSVFCGASRSTDASNEDELQELTRFFRQKLAIDCPAFFPPNSLPTDAASELPAALASPQDWGRLLHFMQELLSRSLDPPIPLFLPVLSQNQVAQSTSLTCDEKPSPCHAIHPREPFGGATAQQGIAKDEEHEELLLQCTRSIRVVLSAAGKIPVQLCVQQGALPLLVQALCCRNREIMFEAAWCVTNIASGSSEDVTALVASGCLVLLFALVFSFHPSRLSSLGPPSSGAPQPHSPDRDEEEVLEQILWALGNIAGDSPHFRDLLLSPDALFQHTQQLQCYPSIQQQPQLSHLLQHYKESLVRLQQLRRTEFGCGNEEESQFPSLQGQLLALISQCRNIQTWRTCVWLLSNLCRGQPRPQLQRLLPVVPLLQHVLLNFQDDEALSDALWALDGLAGHPRGATLLAERRELLTAVIHVLAHCSSACCCRCPTLSATASPDHAAAPSSLHVWPLKEAGGPFARNSCCRTCCGASPKSPPEAETEQHHQMCVRPALRIVGQVATGSVRQTQLLLDCCVTDQRGIYGDENSRHASSTAERSLSSQPSSLLLHILRILLHHERKAVRKDCGWCISNIAVGSLHQLQQLLDLGVLEAVLMQLSSRGEEEEEVRRELLWVVVNACTTADRAVLVRLLELGAVRPVCEMLRVAARTADPKAAAAAVDAVASILEKSAPAVVAEPGTRGRGDRDCSERAETGWQANGSAAVQQSLGNICWDEKGKSLGSSHVSELIAASCGCCCGENSGNRHVCACTCHHLLLLSSALLLEEECPMLVQLLVQQLQQQPAGLCSDLVARIGRTGEALVEVASVVNRHRFIVRQLIQEYQQRREQAIMDYLVRKSMSKESRACGSRLIPRENRIDGGCRGQGDAAVPPQTLPCGLECLMDGHQSMPVSSDGKRLFRS